MNPLRNNNIAITLTQAQQITANWLQTRVYISWDVMRLQNIALDALS